jgi:putative flippase GtrA
MSPLKGEILRFGVVGLINSVFGYLLGVGLFNAFEPYAPALVISLISTSLSIVFSFTMQKLFVFRVRGHWLRQFLKGILVYSFVTLIGAVIFAQLMDTFGLNVWLAQAIVIGSTAIIGFIGSKMFTFKPSQNLEGRSETEVPDELSDSTG